MFQRYHIVAPSEPKGDRKLEDSQNQERELFVEIQRARIRTELHEKQGGKNCSPDSTACCPL